VVIVTIGCEECLLVHRQAIRGTDATSICGFYWSLGLSVSSYVLQESNPSPSICVAASSVTAFQSYCPCR